MLNIGVETCSVDGKCTPTGEVLDHLENRSMWILDMEGVSQPGAGNPAVKILTKV